jgi:hypothetical protein
VSQCAAWAARRAHSLIPADGHGAEVLLQGTGDDKHDMNRLHLDLRTADLEREVERIVDLGPVPAHRSPRDRTAMALAHPH